MRFKSPVRLDWVDPAECSLDYRLKIIGHLPFFVHLPAAAIVKINSMFHDDDVKAEERIYYEGDEAEYLFLVATGKVKLVRSSGSGHDVVMDILHGGEYFGALKVMGGRFYQEMAVAQTDCCILRISAGDFEGILAMYPDVTRKVLDAVGKRLAESQEIIRQLSAFTAEQRIAAALLRLAAKLGEAYEQDVLIQLPFSRQDLAAMTATTTETVSRTMSRLANEGLIRTGRKWVTISDMKGLAKLADQEDDTVN